MKIIKGDLILTKDTTFNEDIKVLGNIKGDYNLTVKGNINCWKINCRNINYYAVCFAYQNIKCKSIKGTRENNKYFVLDGNIKKVLS